MTRTLIVKGLSANVAVQISGAQVEGLAADLSVDPRDDLAIDPQNDLAVAVSPRWIGTSAVLTFIDGQNS